MTSATTGAAPATGDHPGATVLPDVYVVPWTRRRALRRLGRADGAQALPDPDVPRCTTEARSLLASGLYAALSTLWEEFFTAQRTREPALGHLEARIAQAHARYDDARAALDGVGEEPPDSDRAPRAGETAHGRPPELVARRRSRVHEARRGEAQARCERARAEVDRLVLGHEELAASARSQAYRTAVTEHRLIGVFTAERAVYDRALVRRHPRRHVLGPRLDRTAPELSNWARDALAGRVPGPARRRAEAAAPDAEPDEAPA